MNATTVERFLEEARTALSLQHANIVPVFDFGRDAGGLFLVMEWIDGCDLGALLARQRDRGEALPAAAAAHVAAEVCKALTYAHQRGAPPGQAAGILHRDVTPRNLLLSRLGEVRLTDFGISCAVGAAGGPGGTPRYMAPEAAVGGAVDARSDLYSLGLVFAEMLLGEPLRELGSTEEAQRPVPVPAFSGVPEEIAAVARRLLAPEPAARFASAAAAQSALLAPLAAEILRGGSSPAEQLAELVRDVAERTDRGHEPAASTEAGETQAAVSAAPADRRVATVSLAAAVVLVIGVAMAWALSRWLGDGPPDLARRPAAQAGATRPGPPHSPPSTSPPAAAVSEPTPRAPTVEAPVSAGQVARRLAPARLRITAPRSWVAVYLDDQKLADDAGEFDIPSGRHRLRVENPPMRFRREEWIVAHPGQTVTREFHPAE